MLLIMTLKELKEIVDAYYSINQRYHDLEVCIPNNKSGIQGGTSATRIKSLNKGIDWDDKFFFIIPATPMVNQNNCG